MLLPGWNSLESVKAISSTVADITVGFWVLMAVCEVSAVFFPWIKKSLAPLHLPVPGKWVRKSLAGAGLAALVFAVAGEAVGRRCEHRRDFLSDERDKKTASDSQQQIDAAKADAKAARDENIATKQKADDATKRSAEADKISTLAQKVAQAAQGQAEALRLQQSRQEPPQRIITTIQHHELIKLLKRTGAFAIEARPAQNDYEAAVYYDSLVSVLREAGWTVPDIWKLRMIPETRSARGVWVGVNDGKNLPPAASALLSCLNQVGIETKGYSNPAQIGPNAVVLYVGVR
jgi:hypothetical protein